MPQQTIYQIKFLQYMNGNWQMTEGGINQKNKATIIAGAFYNNCNRRMHQLKTYNYHIWGIKNMKWQADNIIKKKIRLFTLNGLSIET